MITVIAGINGAGKSTLAGSLMRQLGGEYFNPDEFTRALIEGDPSLSYNDASSQAWVTGRDWLGACIEGDTDFTFETTLGGTTICEMLRKAMEDGRQVQIFFCGLESADLHIERVKARVARGGHDIPEQTIRARYFSSIANMVRLMPLCYAVAVYDNSSPMVGNAPNPTRLFHLEQGSFVQPPDINIPAWAKPLAAEAIEIVLKG